MTFTQKIEKLLASNHIQDVIDEFLKFLNEVPQSNRDARNDANQLRGQIIILSGRYTDLNNKINTNIIDSADANQEKASLINSFIQILNQLPSGYPDLNICLEEKNEDEEWKDCQRKNTIEAYQFYFSRYPNGKYKADTIKLIGELEEVKLKQDVEIKRLAMLEKERRENDKAAEAKKEQPVVQPQTAYRSTATVQPAAPAKSRKGLYIVLGSVLAVVLLIIVASISTTDEPTKTGTYPVTDYPSLTTERSITEAEKAELISAFKLAENVLINARYNLNNEKLNSSFTGEALKFVQTDFETVKASGYSYYSTVENQSFAGFKIGQDGLDAELQITETWSDMIVSIATNTCYQQRPKYTTTYSVYMKKSDTNGWLISAFVDDNTKLPDFGPCE